jgi:hypothetical protein
VSRKERRVEDGKENGGSVGRARAREMGRENENVTKKSAINLYLYMAAMPESYSMYIV